MNLPTFVIKLFIWQHFGTHKVDHEIRKKEKKNSKHNIQMSHMATWEKSKS